MQFSRFIHEDLVDIREFGFDLVRLPINFPGMTGSAPEHEVDPLLFTFLDEIISWSEELGLHLILDNHPRLQADTQRDVGDFLVPLWAQVAERYRGYAPRMIFEILNEPHGINSATWSDIQNRVVSSIRQVDADRWIVVGGANWNSYRLLESLPELDDPRLIYTFHFYDPFLFTHQGATWVLPSLQSLFGVPFPFDEARMPMVPTQLVDSWVPGGLAAYRREGTEQAVRNLFDIAADFRKARQVSGFCGEIGVFIPNSEPDDRIAWYRMVRTHLEDRGIPWASWDYRGGFGLFEEGTGEQFDYDLNVSLLEALGLHVPPQSKYVMQPKAEGFALFDDGIGRRMVDDSWISAGEVDFYGETEPAAGAFHIEWSGVDRHNAVTFEFQPNRDLSELVRRGFALQLQVRGDRPGVSFDVRFLDGHHPENDDLPWRMRMTVDEKIVTWDGSWQALRLPLMEFTEHGAWDGDFHQPRGLMDWTDIDRFEIVAEHHDLQGLSLSFDDIAIVEAPATAIFATNTTAPSPLALLANYPNPFNASTQITFELPQRESVSLSIFDVLGRRLRRLLSDEIGPGSYRVQWDGRTGAGYEAASGVYHYQLRHSGGVESRQMTLIR
ncbi:MAG: cellulase family glycosylhydrolase [Candidatus Latescibacterota bacterium]|nr:cellulase family glycosylhydrolase [Candidatus Latescibacterota bacterium]